MKKYSIIIAVLSFISINSIGQDWVRKMKDGKTNVHDVQNAFNSWYSNHKEEAKATNKKGKDDDSYALYKRWEWLMEPRTYPSGERPSPAIFSSAYIKLLNNEKAKSPENMQSSANWSYKGNAAVPTYGGDGRVNKLRFYPGNSSIMYACTPTGGLWKTTNGGISWSTNTDQLSELGTSDLAIDPINPTIMYLATGDCDGPAADFWSISTIGVLKSTDGGNTWNPTGLSYTQQSTGPGYGTVTELALNPVNTNIIIAATSNGMYYSANAGATWTQEDTEYFKSVEFEPFHPSTVYAATGDGKFFRSIDGGMSFNQVTNGLPAFGLTARMTIAVTPADSNYVYLVAEDASSWSFYGLYRSTDRGQTFTQRSNSGSGNLGMAYGWYGLPLAVSPTNIDTVLTGGIDVYMSTDGGASWNLNASSGGSPYAHADGHHYIFLPGSGASWFDACDGGVFKATAGGNIYTDLSNNLQIAEIYAIGPSTLTSGLWLSGWQDNGTNESGLPWMETNGGDGMVPFIDYSNDNTMYSSSQGGALYNSFDGGVNWNYIAGPISENGPWVTRWLQDPQKANTLFAGFSNVWESPDQGNTTWNQISNFSSSTNRITALIVDPSNDKVIYTCWHDSIFMTSNGGTSWKNITSNLPVGEAWMTGITVDPNNSSHAWVTFSGYVDTAKVFQTYNGGTNWQNISSGLLNLPVNCIVFQPNNHSGIYVGTDKGVYYHDTILNSWVSYNTGLPNVMVNDLKIVDAGANLLAASYGRGVWETPVYISSGTNDIGNSENQFKVYPNPTGGKVNFTLDNLNAGEYTMTIYNMLGQKVYSNNIKIEGQYSSSLDLSGFGKGVYLFTLNGNGENLKKKIVVE